jgi:hypothetical protein
VIDTRLPCRCQDSKGESCPKCRVDESARRDFEREVYERCDREDNEGNEESHS